MDKSVVYKGYRIYVWGRESTRWLSRIVSLGERELRTETSRTDPGARVPGEYPSRAEALQATKQYIDEVERDN